VFRQPSCQKYTKPDVARRRGFECQVRQRGLSVAVAFLIFSELMVRKRLGPLCWGTRTKVPLSLDGHPQRTSRHSRRRSSHESCGLTMAYLGNGARFQGPSFSASLTRDRRQRRTLGLRPDGRPDSDWPASGLRSPWPGGNQVPKARLLPANPCGGRGGVLPFRLTGFSPGTPP
jgi:hypothetical protein